MSKFALIIGNSEYKDKNLAHLTTPTADVRALAEVLLEKSRGGFDAAKTLINESDSIIRKEIVRFFAEKKKDDLLLLYFSGHGVMDDHGQLYLAAQDTESELLPASAISANFITDTMDRSRSKRKVLILDCCHSGAFFRDTKAVTGAKAVTEATFEGKGGYGKIVLTATDSTQYAWSGDDQVVGKTENSVFTHFLIEGLRGAADTDSDGRITLDELYDYVAQNISSRQTPTKWAYNQQGEFLIATNPFPIIKPAPLSDELLETIEHRNSLVREGAVRELEQLLRGRNKGRALTARETLERIAAEDDSRTVSKLASEVLERNAAVVTPTPAPEPQEETVEQEDLKAFNEQTPGEKVPVENEEVEKRKRIEEKVRSKVAELESEADAAIGKKDWSSAAVKLRALVLLNPDHAETAARLKDVLKELEETKRQQKIADLEREAREAEDKEDWAAAIENLRELSTLVPGQPQVLEKIESVRQKQKLANDYAEGQKFYAAGKRSKALRCFEQVQALDPNYKNIAARIADIKSKLAEESKPGPPPPSEPPPLSRLTTPSSPRDSLKPEVQPEMFTGFRPVDQIRRLWPFGAAAVIVIAIVIGILVSYSSSNRSSSQAETQFNGSPMPTSTGNVAIPTPSQAPTSVPTPDKVSFEKSLTSFIRKDRDMAKVVEGYKTVENGDLRRVVWGDLDGDKDEDAAVWYCGSNTGLGQQFWCKLVAFTNKDGDLTVSASRTWGLSRWVGSLLESITPDGTIIIGDESQEVGNASSPVIKSQTKVVLDGNRLKTVR